MLFGISLFAAAAAGMSPAPAEVRPIASSSATALLQTQRPTADFLLGRWTDNNNCAADHVEFRRDGSFVTSRNREGRWSLSGDQLTFQGTTSATARLEIVDQNTIRLVHPDGSVGGSTRCGAPAATPAVRRQMPAMPASVADALSMSTPVPAWQLIGRWTDNGDCGNAITFVGDGSFNLPNGTSGRWRLEGENLTFTGSSEATARIRAVGRDRILLIHPNNEMGQSVRC